MTNADRRIAVIGLGYVGLPVAVAFDEVFPGVIAFDRDPARIATLQRGIDPTGEVGRAALTKASLHLTGDPADLAPADFYVVAVPTPIDDQRQPDLEPLRAASATVGTVLRPGDIVVFESTVYPGVTEDFCGPILAECSGLRPGEEFTLGYSPERINPGDSEHRLRDITKVVAGQDDRTLDVIARVYGSIVGAGVHRASSIRVAEASKVIENVQRDLNIALMNELAMIMHRLGLDTSDVLDAAATKWNFQRFHPGLVGGHCIGVDPYYLTAKAIQVGITPRVILAGRETNDGMARYVAQQTVEMLRRSGRPIVGSRVALLGLSFKEGVPDIRNSQSVELGRHLAGEGIEVLAHDPIAAPDPPATVSGLTIVRASDLIDLDAVVLAVPHPGLPALALDLARAGTPALIDVRACVPREDVPPSTRLWRL